MLRWSSAYGQERRRDDYNSNFLHLFVSSIRPDDAKPTNQPHKSTFFVWFIAFLLFSFHVHCLCVWMQRYMLQIKHTMREQQQKTWRNNHNLTRKRDDIRDVSQCSFFSHLHRLVEHFFSFYLSLKCWYGQIWKEFKYNIRTLTCVLWQQSKSLWNCFVESKQDIICICWYWLMYALC